MMYYSHNLHFIAMCAAMNGHYAEARKNADLLAAQRRSACKGHAAARRLHDDSDGGGGSLPSLERNSENAAPDPSLKTATVFWHFARGMALAGTGKVTEAEAEYKIVADAEAATPPDAIFQMPINNKTKDIMKIAENVLGARLAVAKKDNAAAISLLREAVAIQDKLNYGEPPDWFYPVRESLGASAADERRCCWRRKSVPRRSRTESTESAFAVGTASSLVAAEARLRRGICAETIRDVVEGRSASPQGG